MPFCTRATDVPALEEQFIREERQCRAEAAKLPPGAERDALLTKARQANTAAHINEWADSPGLQPPE